MIECLVSLGGNLGDVQQVFCAVGQRLEDELLVRDVRISRAYYTAPMGEEAGDAFLNAAVVFKTESSPLEMLSLLLEIEDSFGRNRNVRWGPRTLDLDLILYGEEIIEHDRLTVPHPACWYRRFVLDPACTIAADWQHPVLQQTLVELRQRLVQRPLPIAVEGIETAEQLIDEVQREFPSVSFDDAAEPAIRFCAGAISAERTVSLSGHNPLQHIRDVLTAALDEPVPIA